MSLVPGSASGDQRSGAERQRRGDGQQDGIAGQLGTQRRPDPGHAGRHIYELTEAGRDLWPVLHALLVWGGHHRYPNSRTFRHAGCGTALDAAGRCPACRLTPGPEDIVMEPRPGRGRLRDDPVSAALRAPRRLLDPLEV